MALLSELNLVQLVNARRAAMRVSAFYLQRFVQPRACALERQSLAQFVEKRVRHQSRHTRLQRFGIGSTASPSANHVVELLSCGICPERQASLNCNLERNAKSVARSVGDAEVLVDLILVAVGRWIESAHIKKCAIRKRRLPPTMKIVAPV